MFSILSAILLNIAMAAKPSACPVQKSATLPKSCLIEMSESINNDPLAKALRATLERERPLAPCHRAEASQLKWKFQKDEATGPSLQVSLLYSCDNGEGISGYHITGKYYLDAVQGSFDFQELTLDTYE